MNGDNTALTTSVAAIGKMRSPAWRGELPRSNWRNCVCKNNAPKRPKTPRHSAAAATENLRSRKNASLSIGWGERASQATNEPSTTRLADPTTITRGEVQPWVGPSMMDHSKRPKPRIERTAPPGSGRSAAGFFESRHQQHRSHERRDDDGDVDEEDGTPPEPGQQQASGDRADGDAEADGPAPGADGLCPFLGVTEHVVDDGERRGNGESCAGPHHGAKGNQQVDRTRRGRRRSIQRRRRPVR